MGSPDLQVALLPPRTPRGRIGPGGHQTQGTKQLHPRPEL